ncbi:MAG TPA: DUF503 domain-containing protein [Coprothermobacter proteolyticus]|uniref:DUF503 domain-containing protein n=1 Tax=Coprothermobacter proteolyticus TaxID=35786 RepID=UPI000D2FA55D|nr:DUF503 domain-containing protein [Coprothermobacter proteolyticus]MBP8983327.1 DUF503 domain-containing protein [Coprothermobacter sp.]NLT84285.1 DUF503 domain-containing protein [Coprothermobacter proteolyticus]HOA64705.1 DUF503 domain-containing protein [Coprothermobacter proteolyticus]HOK24076.1 DUF503 domain-containing protein [Coprothermobacter proteolyticus]HOL52923.1 DUF503 domain-containing protein [Coprothermobacter proteolyticus]
MFVGSLRLKLLINGSRTLKDKRQVVRSILDTVRSRRNVAAAEVGSLDNTSVAELGFATVNGQMNKVRESMDWIVNFIQDNYDLEILEQEITVY